MSIKSWGRGPGYLKLALFRQRGSGRGEGINPSEARECDWAQSREREGFRMADRGLLLSWCLQAEIVG